MSPISGALGDPPAKDGNAQHRKQRSYDMLHDVLDFCSTQATIC